MEILELLDAKLYQNKAVVAFFSIKQYSPDTRIHLSMQDPLNARATLRLRVQKGLGLHLMSTLEIRLGLALRVMKRQDISRQSDVYRFSNRKIFRPSTGLCRSIT